MGGKLKALLLALICSCTLAISKNSSLAVSSRESDDPVAARPSGIASEAKIVNPDSIRDVALISDTSTMNIILATPSYFAQCLGFMLLRSYLLEYFFTPLKEEAEKDADAKFNVADPAVHGLLGAAAQLLGLLGIYFSEGSNPISRVREDSAKFGWWVFAVGGMWQYLQTLGENLVFLAKEFDSATVVSALGALVIPMVFLVNLITKLQEFSLMQFFGICLTTMGGLASPLTLVDVEEEKLGHQLRKWASKHREKASDALFQQYKDSKEHNALMKIVDKRGAEQQKAKQEVSSFAAFMELAKPAIGLVIALAGYGFQSVWQRKFGCLRSEEGHVLECSIPSCYCALTGVWQLLYSTIYCGMAKWLGIVEDTWSFVETFQGIMDDAEEKGLAMKSLMSAIGQFSGQQGLAMATYYYGALMSEILYQLGSFPLQIYGLVYDDSIDPWIEGASMTAIALGGFLYVRG